MEGISCIISEKNGTFTLKGKDGNTVTIESKGGKNSSIFDEKDKVTAKDKNGKEMSTLDLNSETKNIIAEMLGKDIKTVKKEFTEMQKSAQTAKDETTIDDILNPKKKVNERIKQALRAQYHYINDLRAQYEYIKQEQKMQMRYALEMSAMMQESGRNSFMQMMGLGGMQMPSTPFFNPFAQMQNPQLHKLGIIINNEETKFGMMMRYYGLTLEELFKEDKSSTPEFDIEIIDADNQTAESETTNPPAESDTITEEPTNPPAENNKKADKKQPAESDTITEKPTNPPAENNKKADKKQPAESDTVTKEPDKKTATKDTNVDELTVKELEAKLEEAKNKEKEQKRTELKEKAKNTHAVQDAKRKVYNVLDKTGNNAEYVAIDSLTDEDIILAFSDIGMTRDVEDEFRAFCNNDIGFGKLHHRLIKISEKYGITESGANDLYQQAQRKALIINPYSQYSPNIVHYKNEDLLIRQTYANMYNDSENYGILFNQMALKILK